MTARLSLRRGFPHCVSHETLMTAGQPAPRQSERAAMTSGLARSKESRS